MRESEQEDRRQRRSGDGDRGQAYSDGKTPDQIARLIRPSVQNLTVSALPHRPHRVPPHRRRGPARRLPTGGRPARRHPDLGHAGRPHLTGTRRTQRDDLPGRRRAAGARQAELPVFLSGAARRWRHHPGGCWRHPAGSLTVVNGTVQDLETWSTGSTIRANARSRRSSGLIGGMP